MFALVLLRCQEKFVPVNGYPLFMVDDFFESDEAGGDEREKPQSAFGRRTTFLFLDRIYPVNFIIFRYNNSSLGTRVC